MKTLLVLLVTLGSGSAHASSNIVRCRGIDATYLPFYNVEIRVLATQSRGDSIRLNLSVDKKVQLGGFTGPIETIHQDLTGILVRPNSHAITLYGENESGSQKVGFLRLEQDLSNLRHAFLKLDADLDVAELACE